MVLNRHLPFLVAAGMLLACGSAVMDDTNAPPPTEGEMVFNTNCAMCHGRKGDLGMSGAKNLVTSTLKRNEVIAMVTNGKGTMMPYGKTLSKEQIKAVADHVLTLRAAKQKR